MKRYLNVATMLASIGLICTSANAQTFPHETLGRQMLENHIRPTYQVLVVSFARLHKTTHDSCADGAAGPDELDRIDTAFRNAVFAWSKASHLRFGPATENNRFERIAFWPDRKGRGRQQVKRLLRGGASGKQSAIDAATLSNKSVAVQGLTALEVVLYGTRLNSQRVDTLNQFSCSFANAITDRLMRTADAIHTAWQTNGKWSNLWLQPGPTNPAYLSQIEITREFAHAFLHGMQDLRDRHLVAPLGFVKGRLGRVYRPVFAASGLSTTYLRGGVMGHAHMFNEGGLRQTLHKFNGLQTNSVDWQFKETLKAARDLDASPTSDFASDSVREPAVAMGFPMKTIIFYVSTLLRQHASLSLGFNASDGD